MTSSKVELPGEVKNDPAALMASLHLVPSPVPNPEIKYTKVRETFYNFFQESKNCLNGKRTLRLKDTLDLL